MERSGRCGLAAARELPPRRGSEGTSTGDPLARRPRREVRLCCPGSRISSAQSHAEDGSREYERFQKLVRIREGDYWLSTVRISPRSGLVWRPAGHTLMRGRSLAAAWSQAPKR